MGNDQKPRCLSCIAIEPPQFQDFGIPLYGYHTQQLKNITIPVIAFSPYSFKLLPTR